MSHAPAIIRLSNPLASRLLRLGMPMGPNILMTVRGRTSGEPRSAPVAVLETEGRRFVIGAYGDVNWTRNLRAAGEADFRLHGRTLHLHARELDLAEATHFYRVTFQSFIRHMPWFGRAFAKVFFGAIGPEFMHDPDAAAAGHPVFELTEG